MSLPSNLFISEKSTLKQAMKKLDQNGWGILLIVNDSKKLKGLITPGDIRRAIEVGVDIQDSVKKIMNKEPLIITESTRKTEAISEVLKFIARKEKEIKEPIEGIKIPVINSKKQVVSLASFSQSEDDISFSFKPSPVTTQQSIKRVLIVGGAGYLGSVLTRQLLDKGYLVRVLDFLPFGEKPVEALYDEPNYELMYGDMRDIESIHSALDRIDAVISLAAIVGDPASQHFPQETIGINYLATMTLALASKYYQINKFIFASTCSVYGIGSKRLDEKAALHPVSLYARTKIESERGILGLADENFRPIIMRMSTLYGWSPRMRFDLVINTFAKMATTEKKITIFGGDQWRPLLHVADAARAYILMLENPLDQFDNLIFNVGANHQNYQIKELGQFVKEVLPKTKIIIQKPQAEAIVDKRTYEVSFDKIEKGLNFTTQHSVKSALKEISDAIKNGEIKDVNHADYYNFVG